MKTTTLFEYVTKGLASQPGKVDGRIRGTCRQAQGLWCYRELAIELFWTYLKLRYVGSVLGFIWTMLNPILYILTYWLVFSFIIRVDLPNFPLFLIPGFLAWNFTLSSLIEASDSIISGKFLITKVAFPIEILTLTRVAVTFFDFIISMALYLIAVTIFRNTLTVTILALPLVIVVQLLFTLGIAFLVACGSVYFRDIPKLVQVLGTIFFFLTPIFYPLSFIPESIRPLIQLNPMTHIITTYHDLLYYGVWPEPGQLFGLFLLAITCFAFGFWVFSRKKHTFAELT